MNETQAMPAPGTYFATNNGNGSIADGLALASLRDGSLDEVTAWAAMDTKHEVWKAESDVQKAIQVQTNLINANNLSHLNRLHEVEKSAIEAKFESKLEVKEAVTKLSEKIDREADRTNSKIETFRAETKDNFGDLERRIDRQFSELRERELVAEIGSLRGQVAGLQSDAQSKTIIDAVLGGLRG